ncbi:pentatricopeptide repeat-containing protein At2g20710, mitochondrial-like [Lotus japonicus]|uniref:pentatricopeptide repeat-containing protein At2g20710, mitochondrial-like n=1 Tax=Lotus japonicus TaxID=34305 RepID=UPI00258F663C|nr:pentatricopeptide repeat-containing protein At2g20710, mitochondrial-like [Lotus japonicus]XP_057455680.1 pentatricopeptide repeat-containing protein At2g20710, mitochondrial-like [Lotus japonicus]XP_057455681.1 pentatricopeptide repeat-containing protein At2g20710, mitochondrial-like [Lotus japonicus]
MNRIASKWNLNNTLRLFSSSSSPTDSLFLRISRSGDPAISITPLLNQWVEEGRPINHAELQFFIKQLRAHRRFNHALQISEWMSNERNLHFLSANIAIRLDLIAKVRGLSEAEKYFRSTPYSSRDFKVYGALLNCYAQHGSVEKAEAIMQKIKEYSSKRVTCLVLSYNVMLKLYARTGQSKKSYDLMREMIEKDLWDCVTVNTWLRALVESNDINEMEKLLAQTEVDPLITVDWLTYCTAADGYIKACRFDKSLAMLKKSEQLIERKMRRVAYESLMIKYAAIGKKDDVYRIWNMCKNFNNILNSSYISLLTALSRLNDVDGAERIMEKWESGNTRRDIRVPNVMVSIYCKNGLLEKAEAYVGRLLERDSKLDGSIWDRLAGGYYRCKDMDKVVETMKKAILAGRPGWKAHPFTLAACIEHMKEKGDSDLASEILRMCGERGYFSATTHDRLSRYMHGEILKTNALNLIKEDYGLGRDL